MTGNNSPSPTDKSNDEPLHRRYVTILFSDLCSSVHLADSSDPEDVAEVLHQIRQTTNQVVSKYGGILNQFYGDGILSVFGLPDPDENDTRQAIEAALELHEVVQTLSLQKYLPPSFLVRLHSGIDSGLVVVEAGNPQEGNYKLIGDPPNTAARLSGEAKPDEIIVSANSLSGAKAFFDTKIIAPLSLRGKSEPILAYQVLGRRVDVKTRFEASIRQGLTPFVGRENELSDLKQALRDILKGRLRIASVVGDVGLGKTRIIEEFLRKNNSVGYQVYRGYFEGYRNGAPLQPFLQMLSQIFKLDAEMSVERSIQSIETSLTQLGANVRSYQTEYLQMFSLNKNTNESAGPRQQQLNITAALTALFNTLAEQSPIVLFIDDWQWADDASRQALSNLIQTAADKPIFVLTASRALDPSDPAMSQIVLRLTPFDAEDSKRTIAALLAHGFDLEVSQKIHERSGGNALFIEELCRFPVGVDMPATLHGLIEQRVERLPKAQADLVRTAAVIGNIIPTWLLEKISDYYEQEGVLHSLASNDLIYAGAIEGTLCFKHGITRDVVYNRLGLQQRRALHLRIAETLQEHDAVGENRELLETLAYHYTNGGDHLQAILYSEKAGDKALSSSSLDRARQQYRVALMALERLDPTAEVHQRWLSISRRWALACTYSPARDQLDILNKTIEHARAIDDTAGVAHAYYWLGWINYALGEQLESIRHYERALRIAREINNPKLATQTLATIGQSHAAAGHYDQALPYLDEAINIRHQPSSKTRPPVDSSYAMACKALVLADRGQFDDAHEVMNLARDAIDGAEQAIEGSILSMQSAIFLWQGRWSEVLTLARRAQTIAERFSLPYIFSMSRALEGYAGWMLERAPSSLETLQQASDWLEEQDMCLYLSLNHGWLADAMTAAGKNSEARKYGLLALDRVYKDDRLGEAMACRALARIASRSQESELQTPDYYLGLAIQSAQARQSRHEEAVNRLHQADLYISLDRLNEARDLLEQAQAAFADMQMWWHLDQAEQLKQKIF